MSGLPSALKSTLATSRRANVAVTLVSAFIVTLQPAIPEQPPPLQPMKVDCEPAAALKAITVPATTVSVQSPKQAMPAPLTLPLPLPAKATVSVCIVGAFSVNVAVTVTSPVTVMLQLPAPVQPPPLQPAKVEPPLAAALNVTPVPDVTTSVQSPGHAMPVPVTLPDPEPFVATVSVYETTTAAASNAPLSHAIPSGRAAPRWSNAVPHVGARSRGGLRSSNA